MRTRTTLFGLAAALVAIYAFSSEAEADPEFTVNFGTVAPAGTPWAIQLEEIKDRIETKSNGRIKVKMFLGGTMGSEIEMIQDVSRGERLQGGGFSTGALGEALDVPLLQMVELPYLFRSNAEADAVLDGVLYDPTTEMLAEKGITFYAWSENGWRNMATNGGPARTPEELRNFKMRSQESPVHQNMYEALGVQSESKPVTQVLSALNNGVVTGFDNTPLFSVAAGWVDPITHYTMTRHIYQPAGVVYAKPFVDSLPPDLRAILLEDPEGESRRGRAGVRGMEQELLAMMKDAMGKEVIELTEDEQTAYRRAIRAKVHAAFLQDHADLQGLYAEVKAMLQSMR
jgi:TRAP-type C4-dicarboxylate transport system substrate-binding protein